MGRWLNRITELEGILPNSKVGLTRPLDSAKATKVSFVRGDLKSPWALRALLGELNMYPVNQPGLCPMRLRGTILTQRNLSEVRGATRRLPPCAGVSDSIGDGVEASRRTPF